MLLTYINSLFQLPQPQHVAFILGSNKDIHSHGISFVREEIFVILNLNIQKLQLQKNILKLIVDYYTWNSFLALASFGVKSLTSFVRGVKGILTAQKTVIKVEIVRNHNGRRAIKRPNRLKTALRPITTQVSTELSFIVIYLPHAKRTMISDHKRKKGTRSKRHDRNTLITEIPSNPFCNGNKRLSQKF